MERWHNRVAVVTGDSSGIGAECSKLLVAKGMVVVGLARRKWRMDELKANLPKDQETRFHPVYCDVTKEADILRSFAWIESELGGVDVLVNNAGIARSSSRITGDDNSEDLKVVLDTNILGVALCTREAFRSMKKRDVDGHVVLVNSICGHKLPSISGSILSIYPCTKYALTAMTEILRQEFLHAETKIKVTSISPGVVDTEMIPEEFPTNIPMLQSEDVAEAIAYCIQTPLKVEIHEMILKPLGETI